jgi:hypothetical protein
VSTVFRAMLGPNPQGPRDLARANFQVKAARVLAPANPGCIRVRYWVWLQNGQSRKLAEALPEQSHRCPVHALWND